ncbi:MAG TPA: hypothetical protein VLL52_18545 [Anaerolineae bacterium]|nr:hypothetical protein [Anaerolineae bacterium]
MIETIQQAVKPHDRYQIEIKLDYKLSPSRYTRYKIITYFFIPQSLGVNRQNYPQKYFYHDVQNYIRLKTPHFILRDFTENSASPLLSIEYLITQENWAIDPDCQKRIIHNLKFLSAMLKSSIREHFSLIEQRIDQAPPRSKIDVIIHNLIAEFIEECFKITRKYRAFYTLFNLPNVNQELFLAYTLTDESISLMLEESAIEMFQIVETYFKKGKRTKFTAQLNELVHHETKHRRIHGYPSILNPNSDNEEYLFRSSVLKKYAATILYLSTAVRRDGVGLEQLLFAIAAGLSMIFATMLAFYAQQRFDNFSLALFTVLVVGYMFKDRIKDLSRTLFARYLANKLYDRRILIKTQDGKHKLGVLKEKVSFIDEDELPTRIATVRNRDTLTELDNDGQGEKIIRHVKEVTLYTKAFKNLYVGLPEITSINDIIRYDIHTYLNKMADPIQHRFYLQDEQLHPISCHKVYQVNIVSKYITYPQKEHLYKRIRLILNQKGIKRVEHLET